MDLLNALDNGRVEIDWGVVSSEHNGYTLHISVFRDALKVEGIRWPATAVTMQQIADKLNCTLLTPKVCDLIWLAAGESGVQFDPVINHAGTIVADLTVPFVSQLVDAEIEDAGCENGGVIASVGKYWVLTNKLMGGKFGHKQACNYGWHSSKAPYHAVTKGLKVWQSIGSRHNSDHIDPSQVVKLMSRDAVLQLPYGGMKEVDLELIAQDPELCPLISHEGPLKVLRQPGVS